MPEGRWVDEESGLRAYGGAESRERRLVAGQPSPPPPLPKKFPVLCESCEPRSRSYLTTQPWHVCLQMIASSVLVVDFW